MKWVYLPIVFALAFFYTKMSYTDFLPKHEAIRTISRGPASLGEAEKLKPFRQRVPPADFYKNIETEGLSVFSPVNVFSGTIVSDVHVDNFGFIIDDQKHVDYQVLDFKETSRGKFYHDVLSHLVSAKALDKRTAWMDYFESYKKGLKGYAHINSFYVDKGINDAISDAENNLENTMTHDFPIVFTKVEKGFVHLSAVEKDLVETELKRVLPKAQIFDIITNKESEKEYHALLRVRPSDKVQWLVMRESGVTDHDEFFGPKLTSARQMDKIKEDIYSNHLNESIFLLRIDNKAFSAFYYESFSSRLDLDDIPFEDYHDIILDQANVLGRIHARSLRGQVDDYIKAWAKIPAASVDEKTIEIKYKFKDFNE